MKLSPAQLRMVDLERVAVERDPEFLTRHRVHLDAGGGLVVADDVDLAAHERDLQPAHGSEVDYLRPVDQPLSSAMSDSSLLVAAIRRFQTHDISRLLLFTIYRV